MALEAPTTCSSLKDFVVAALELASYAFFSTEWYSALGPQLYVTLGNAARAYVKDLAPAALEAADACWRAVEPQLDTCGGQERLAACRALVAGLAEGLRLLAKKSAESINDPQVPREMRSFGGVNVLWTSLTRALTGLPPDGMPQLLSGGVVAAVLRGLLGHLVAEARALPGSGPADFDTRIKVARFWLQHIVKTVQAHPAAGAGCWPELCAAASDMYRHIASCGYAATGAGAAAAGASGQPGSQQPGAGAGPGAGAAASPHARAAQDLESVVMLKLTSLIAMTLEAAAPVLAWSGFPAAGAPPAGPGTGGQQPGLVAAMLPASQHDIQERLSQLEALARPSSASAPSTLPAAAAPPPPPPAACCGAVMLALALMQRAAHLGPDTRAAMAGRLLPWAGHAVSTRLYDLALELGGPAAAAPCLDLPHQMAAAALTLTAVAADAASHPHQQQHQHHPQLGAAPAAPPPPGGQDVDTFQVACGVLCNWGSCAHPLLSTAAADVLSTLVAHCQPALGGRLTAAVARLAGLAAAAEAAAAVAVGHVVEGAGAARRLERLLSSLIAAAPPGAGATWRQVLDPHLHFSATHGSAAGPDTCSAATARALWGAAAGAAGAAAAAAAAGHAAPTTQGSAGPPLGSGRGCVTEQELAARASQLLTAVKQATAILTAAAPGAGGTPAAAAAASLLRPWLAQLLGCLEVTLAHAQSLATCGGAGAGDGGSGGGGASSCSALQPLVAQAGVAAVELLQTLSEDAVNTTSTSSCGVSGTPASLQAAHAAVRLLARAAPAMLPAALAEAAPALTRLAEAGPPEVVADVAAAAEFCTSPPPEALFHVLLRHPHPAVTHAALHSKIRICRTVPEQHKPALRRLLPPDPSGAPGPPPHLTALIKSYWSRRLSDEEAAAAAAAASAPRARAAEAARLEGAAREACLPDAGLGRPAASSALQRAVSQGGEALTAAATTLAAAAAAAAAASAAAAAAAASCVDADMVCEGGLAGLGATAPSAAGAAAGGGAAAAGAASGPLKGFIADDKAAVGGVAVALGGLEGCLRALAAAVRAQGLHPGRPSQDWDQLQAHVRALLGDLSSASSRIRTCTDMLHSLQGR
ncbi:hypothetical protein CHLRE_14g614450v5 [Chlamydomonas reinhardtii]|uniref:Uncharacterized protein n=1 Tax=Chlamydomonas reinhardtii TaxID=3055 RepID=A0A2K3CXI4_CHLRE|nr:uncharacterized protein CHLRE_14g614450v5 [Chlamydomonas reinhardtii]PNW72988.1 hypothetical protein CHLRE_14g614450v5 [Chlamydomonas reinhardtii]